MNIKKLYLAILILAVVSHRATCATYAPSWVTNSYVQAGNEQIISTLTGNNQTPTYIFNFANAFPNIPNLGYGLKNYIGSDYFIEEKFEVNRTGLTATSFSVLVQIQGYTNIYSMNVPFIAIDPTFPHHLNSFDNVPINQGSTLVNITTATTAGPTQYHNTIDYTAQVGNSSRYNTFLTPFSRNKILLFMTSLYITGTSDSSGTVYPVDIRVTATVVSSSQYQLSVTLSINLQITRLHFSMIIFDKQDVQSTGLYMLVYKRVDWTDVAGGFQAVPFQFQDNFIMGLTDLSGPRTTCSIDFDWNFNTQGGVQGVQMLPTHGLGSAGNNIVINRVGLTIFYLKTWVCPDQTFFDTATDLCVGCPVNNCITCLSEYVCAICDTANGYTLNAVTGQCGGGGSTPTACPDCQKIKIQRDGCNSFKITVGKQLYDGTNATIANPNVEVAKVEEVAQGLQIYASYTSNFLNSAIDLSIGTNFNKQLRYDPVTPAVLYTQEQCSTMENITRLLKGVQVMSYIVLILSIISLKIVGLELFGVLQLSYYTLISHSYFDLYLSPLSQFKTFSGLNVDLIPTNSALLPENIKGLNLSSAFLNNFNVMLFLTLLQLFVGLVLYFVGRFTVSERARSMSTILFKQGFITLIIFNLYNVSFSAGLQWKYDTLNTTFNWGNNLILIICLVGILVGVVLMQLSTKDSHYGEFKKKFKDTWTCRIYILLSIVMRICLGMYSAFQNDYQESTLFILAMVIVFVMYNIINLPFNDALQNYRACFCHVTMLVILLTTNYYRSMKSNTPMLLKAHIHTPAIVEIVLITICLFLSMGVLTYEIVKLVMKYKADKTIVEEAKPINQTATHPNLQQITENSIQVFNN